jgi:WD40 repeat protein
LQPATQSALTVVCAPASSDARRRNLVALGSAGSSTTAAKKKAAVSSLYVWSLHSNHILGYLRGHTAGIQSLHASPAVGDEAIVSTSKTGEVRLWDLRLGDQCIAQANAGGGIGNGAGGGGGAPAAACFAHDGRYLAIAGIGKSGPGALRQEVCVYDRRMLSAGGDWRPVSASHCAAWDEANRPQTLNTMKMDGFSRVEFSPDGRLLVVTPRVVARPLLPGIKDNQRRRGPLLAPHFVLRRGDGGNGGGGNTTEYGVMSHLPSDMNYAEEMAYKELSPSELGVGGKQVHHLRSVATFSPDSKNVVFGDTRNVVQVWRCVEECEEEVGVANEVIEYDTIGKVRGGMKRIASWKGHIGAIGPIAWSPRTELVASGGGNLIMWLPRAPQVEAAKSNV